MPESILMPSSLPAIAVLEVTYRCNHKCLFCSCPWEATKNEFIRRPELTTSEFKDMLLRLAKAGVSSFSFTGGEPLLREDIKELVTFASDLDVMKVIAHDEELKIETGKPELHLNTNGVLVNDEFLKLCAEHRLFLTISLPGLQTYSYLTGCGDPSNALDAIIRAHKMGVSVTAAITVTRLNLQELYETIAVALMAGADQILLNRFMIGGRGIDHADELPLGPEGIREMLRVAEGALKQANRYGALGTEIPACLLDGIELNHLRVSTRCAAVTKFITVDPSGYIRVCNHSPIQLCYYTELETVAQHPLWKSHARKDYHPTSCSNCDKIWECDAGCRAAAHICSGDIKGTDPDLLLSGT